MKAKNLFILAIIAIAGFCLFGCDENTVQTESINFVDESINLLVGDSVFPEVKVLPSYATDKSYTLISGDITALKVDGLKVTGLKAMRGVALKVVSNENENLNDVIMVDIFDEATDLSTPAGDLNFDGDKFSFNAVDNASSYMLKIEGDGFVRELNIGNNTTYDWKLLEQNVGRSLTDAVYAYSVKAVGDGVVYKDSAYGEKLEFVNISSVSNIVLNGTDLSFTSVENVLRYDAKITNLSTNTVVDKTIEGSSINPSVLTFSVEDVIDYKLGGEYLVEITASKQGYAGELANDKIFVTSGEGIQFKTLGQVQNVGINNRVISWDLLNGADAYDLYLYKDGSDLQSFTNLTNNTQTFEYTDAGEYVCEIIARSNKSNVVDATMRSQALTIKILSAPTIEADSNNVSWASVEDAGGYLVCVKNSSGEIIENKYILGNELKVGHYDAGEYFIQVESYGNNENIITSAKSTEISWRVLNAVAELKVQGGKLSWKEEDENSLNSYQLVIQKQGSSIIEKTLTQSDLGENYVKQDDIFSYNLNQYEFDAGEYEVKVTSVGTGNIFDAEYSNLNLTKLADSEILGISNGVISIKPVDKAVSYLVRVYDSSDVEFVSQLMELEVEDYKAVLRQTELVSGSYVARVFTFGGINILDADNLVENTGSLDLMKLKTPALELDKTNYLVGIKAYSESSNYQFVENEVEKQLSNGQYDLSKLVAGEYVYKVKSLGNGAKILDSDFTDTDNSIRVRKITEPNITFDKQNLTFTITCADEQYISGYDFKINGTTIQVEDGVADCSAIITTATDYEVVLKAIANQYADLFVIGETASMAVNMLDGSARVAVADGKLEVIPSARLEGQNYTLKLRVVNLNGDELELTGFNYVAGENAKFTLDIYDSEYNIKNIQNAEGIRFFDEEDTYTLFAVIDNQDSTTVASNERELENKLHILGKVDGITRNAETIEFNAVDDATGYKAYLTYNTTHYFDINPNIEDDTCSLSIAQLIEIMEQENIDYVENVAYTIGIIAINSNSNYVLSKSRAIDNYSFEFLLHPDIAVVEGEDNVKYLVIKNTNQKVTNYNVVLSQGDDNEKTVWYTRTTTDTKIDLATFTQFGGGEISIRVKANSSTGNYFESSYSNLTAIKLASEVVQTEDGLLVWNEVANSKQYNLYYTRYGTTNKIVLTEQSENFVIDGGKCKYDFVDLEEGLVDVYLQVDAVAQSDKIYINSNDGSATKNIYKMSNIKISVADGKIDFEFKRKDWELANRIELLVDNKIVEIDFLEYLNSVGSSETSAIVTKEGEEIIKYPVANVLTREKLGIKYYTAGEKVLNSQVAYKDIAGLLSPTALDVNTSTTTNESSAIKEVLEKITWNNPNGNLNYVAKYCVEIEYNKEKYTYETQNEWLLMPRFDDKNSNGILDDGEVEFGAGDYKIRVMSFATDESNDYVVNSKYCEQIEITILAKPTGLKTESGDLCWDDNTSAEYFLVRIYLVNGADRSLIASIKSIQNKFDLTLLEPFENGVYAVTIQAMHDGSKILTSDESDEYEVVRLPQVEAYYINQGQLWVKAHVFFSRIEIYLRKAGTGELLVAEDGTVIKFTIQNPSLAKYTAFTQTMTTWSTSTILDTYSDAEYFDYFRYIGNNNYTLAQAVADGYNLDVKLIGNSAERASIISGHTAVDVRNEKFDEDLVKLEEPNVAVSDTIVGRVDFNMQREYKSLQYYIDNETSLKGVYLYEVSIQGDNSYRMYVAEIFDQDLFKASVPEIEQDDEAKHNLKHFMYGGACFNVLDSLSLDFTMDEYYYYNIEGEYSLINFSLCGSFTIRVRLLGDDTHFATSNYSSAVNIYRYRILNVSVTDGKLSWLSQANVGDYPIYIITLTSAGKEYNLVLYNPALQSLNSVKSCLDSDKDYKFDTITYTLEDETITYSNLANIVAQCLGNNLGGTFTVNIKAHHTDKTSTNKVLSQGTIPSAVTILPETQIGINKGTLSWAQTFVMQSSGKDYISDYELEIVDSTGKKFVTILKDGDYKLTNHIASYEMPKRFMQENDVLFEFDLNMEYTFKLRAMAGNGASYINSTQTSTDSLALLPMLSAEFKGGVLTWTNPKTNSVQVNVSYTSGDNTIIYESVVSTDGFDLPRIFTDIYGISGEFTADYNYSIKIRLFGGDGQLNGFYSEPIVVNRLASVSQLITQNGKLIWNSSSVEDSTYKVFYTFGEVGEASIWLSSEELEDAEFAFEGLNSGVITAYVQAYNDKYFKSFASEQIELFKLSVPTNIRFNEGTTTISWDKVLDKDGKEIDNYKVKISEDGQDPFEQICTTNMWEISGVSTSKFSISVMAIGTAENDGLINSEYCDAVSMERPDQVDGTTFKYVEELNRFEWKAISSEQSADKYYIGFNYYKSAESSLEKIEEAVASYRMVNGEKIYYYEPYRMGVYRQIYVQIKRAVSLSSQATYCVSDNGNFVLTLELFGSGDGKSEKTAYTIQNENHLRNIGRFPIAYYKLTSNVSLETIGSITDKDTIFSGIIDGGNYYINNYIATQSNLLSEYLGLFAKAEGAVFKNLNIANFTIQGNLNSQNLYLGVLVGFADECSFDNVVVTSGTIRVVKDNITGYLGDGLKLYIGGIVGKSLNCEITNCKAVVNTQADSVYVNIESNASTWIYVGGIVGGSDDSTSIQNSTTELKIRYILKAVENYPPNIAVGTLVGYSPAELDLTDSSGVVYKYISTDKNEEIVDKIGKVD